MSTDREEFKTLLYSSILESTTSSNMVSKVNEILRNWIKSNIPACLYRYRKASPRSIRELENDEIWGSSITTFNDPYECTPCYDLQKIKNEIHNEMNPDKIIEKFETFKKNGNQVDVFNVFYDEDKDRMQKMLPERLDIEQISFGLSILETVITQFLDNYFYSITSDYFTAVFVEEAKRIITCFSEVKDSTLMWGHYADSHKGFCVEYDFRDIVKSCEYKCENPMYCMNMMMNTPIAPIIYSDKRYDASATLLNHIIKYLSDISSIKVKPFYEDYLFVLKCLLTKSTDWCYEREWRMFAISNEMKEHSLICKHIPSAVYIGSKMSNDDAENIFKICQNKKIQCYKMNMNYASNDYSLQPILYEEYRKISLGQT